MGKVIEHVVPQVGRVSISLYSPSDWLHDILFKHKEIRRLSILRHLGALAGVPMSGARLARWDYSVALLHYSTSFNISNFNSKFRIGDIEFSSCVAALQCISLVWNVGHLPGTFSTEKGVYRYLFAKNPNKPANALQWPHISNPAVKEIRRNANEYLQEADYSGVCRVLCVIKLLSFCESENDDLFNFVVNFVSPFVLRYENTYSAQWEKLRKAFNVIRHLAYLTVDLPFSGHRWAPNIPDVLDHYVRDGNTKLDVLSEKISELLSPIEKDIYDAIYHSDDARKEMAIFSHAAEKKLKTSKVASEKIEKWSGFGLTRDLKLGHLPARAKFHRCVSIRLRSHFSVHPDSCVELEKKLKDKGYSYAPVFEYKSWNSDTLLEPDELLVDVLLDRTPTATDLGGILYWYAREFDKTDVKPDDFYYMTRKGDIESGYHQILSRAVEAHFPSISVDLVPWRLNQFGLFKDYSIADNKGKIWAASAEMDDPISNHLFRDRSKSISKSKRELYKELMGLRALRAQLRKEWKTSKPRCRWLVVTSSVRFLKENREIIEYDGGLLKVSARSGKLTWYGLETKSGSENPARSLRKRLEALGIAGNVHAIDNSYAYVELPL